MGDPTLMQSSAASKDLTFLRKILLMAIWLGLLVMSCAAFFILQFWLMAAFESFVIVQTGYAISSGLMATYGLMKLIAFGLSLALFIVVAESLNPLCKKLFKLELSVG